MNGITTFVVVFFIGLGVILALYYIFKLIVWLKKKRDEKHKDVNKG